MNFSERLKTLRVAKGITQKQTGELICINDRTYRRYESGEIDPPLSKMVILANYFEVSLDYLVGLSDNPERRK